MAHCQTSNIKCTSVGNKLIDYSDVVGASPVGAAPTDVMVCADTCNKITGRTGITATQVFHLNSNFYGKLLV